MSDTWVPFATLQGAFGTPAIVMVAGRDPVAATIVWMSPVQGDEASGFDLQRHVVRRVMAVGLAEVPELPTGSFISAPEPEGTYARDWVVDGEERRDYDHRCVFVVLEET